MALLGSTVSSEREENKGTREGREENLKSDYVERREKERERERDRGGAKKKARRE